MKRIISFRSWCIRTVVLGALIAGFHVVGSATTINSTIPVGTGPVRIAVSPTMNRAYVSNRDSDTISVIDTTTHTVIGGVFVQPAQSAPHGIAVTPDGSEIWVANRASGTVNIINANSLQVVGLINVGGQPDVVVFSHDGTRAYITNTTFGLGVYSTVTDTPFGFIPVPSVHKSLVVSADDRVGYLGVNEPDGSNVRTLLLDLTNVAGLSTVSVLGEIHDTWLTLFNQNASTGWGFKSTTNTISLVHLGRLEIRTNITVSPSPQAVALSVNGKRLYVACDLSNEVRVFAASNGQHLETLSVSGRPSDIVVLPDGMTAYVAQLDASSIAVLSL
jgi:YVTN family beta-propeller protein